MKTIILTLIFIISIGYFQDSGRSGWKKLAEKENLFVDFLFYSEADNTNNGVVVKIENRNSTEITFKFDLIFRSSNEDVTLPVRGHLKAGEVKTGSNDSLFWIPFKDGRFISEVGLTNFRVQFPNDKKKED